MKTGFEIKMEADEAELSLYGVIGTGFWADIDSAEVVQALSDVRADKLTLLMNTPGGDPFAGFAIKNRIEKLVEDGQIKEVHTVAEGLVASAGTLPYLIGTTRTMRNGSRFMIHEAVGMGWGKAQELRDYADELERTNAEAAELYAAKSNLSAEDVETVMAAETWYSPAQALEAGFATHRVETFAAAACVSREMLEQMFGKVPEDLETDESRQAETDKKAAELRKKVFADV